MTTNIYVNHSNRTLTLTSKKFADAASRYGTDAYNELQAARRDNPDYRVVIKSTRSNKSDKFKGLTYDYMERYIIAHDDENGSTLEEFNDLRATSEVAKALGAEAATYGEVKEWFFQQYPAFAEFQKKRESVLNAVAEKKAAAKAAAA